MERGATTPHALAAEGHPAWRVLAVAWHLAERSGGPLAPALVRVAAALRGLGQLRERRDVLLSGPRATVRLVAALPVVTFVLGGLLGFQPLEVIRGGPGAAVFALGVVLWVSGVLWARALHERVAQQDKVDGIEYELMWIAVSGGAPPATALLRVVDAVDEYGAEWIPFDRFRRDGRLAAACLTATTSGVALRPMLRSGGEEARARAHAQLEQAAERLSVRVLIPLGVCVLPAFIAIGVAPVVISMFGGF